MTGSLLRQYEEWPDGGIQPSPLAFANLARLYRTDPADLLDQLDRDALPSADLLLLTQQEPEASSGGSSPASVVSSLVGQATAALAFGVALIYAAGGLSLGLKLWFMKVPWTPVLGQIPRDLLIATAVGQVVLPSLIAGAAIGIVIDAASVESSSGRRKPSDPVQRWRRWLRDQYWQARPRRFLFWTLVLSLFSSAAFGIIPVLILIVTGQSQTPGFLQPRAAIWICCGLIDLVALFAVQNALRLLYGRTAIGGRFMSLTMRRAAAGALSALAVMPLFCSISGSFLLPPVYLCGANYLHPAADHSGRLPGYMDGNLIGSNSQWIYLAQFQWNGTKVVAAHITAVPESKVDLQSIGRSGGCNDLVKK